MRKLVISLDNTLDEWLAGEVNQNETVRNALYLYKEDITTPDTLASIKKSYKALTSYMKSHFEVYDESFKKMDRLINDLQNRMQ